MNRYAFQGGKAEPHDPPTRPQSKEMRAIYDDIQREIREERGDDS
jgi:hypothetical protein